MSIRIGILIMGIIISLKRTKITLYNEFIEFSDCTNKILLGLTSSKYMKDVRVPYSSIISVKADSAHCQIYISLVEGKQHDRFAEQLEALAKAGSLTLVLLFFDRRTSQEEGGSNIVAGWRNRSHEHYAGISNGTYQGNWYS